MQPEKCPAVSESEPARCLPVGAAAARPSEAPQLLPEPPCMRARASVAVTHTAFNLAQGPQADSEVACHGAC